MRRGEYPDDWDDRRRRVLERDDYQCQQCGAGDRTLQVHHITPISEGGGHELSNLETVCRECHAAEHPTKVKINKALTENRRIRMQYSSSSGTRVRELDPYGMEMHEGIQYLVGHDYYRDEIRTFRPTRIEWLEVLDQQFTKPSGWDTKQYLIDDMGYQRGRSRSKDRGQRRGTGDSSVSIDVPDGVESAILFVTMTFILTTVVYTVLLTPVRVFGIGEAIPGNLLGIISLVGGVALTIGLLNWKLDL